LTQAEAKVSGGTVDRQAGLRDCAMAKNHQKPLELEGKHDKS